MVYKLVVTEHADKLLDNLVYHLLYRLKNEQAAMHLLDGIEDIYSRLVKNTITFPISKDTVLSLRGYREAVVHRMNYTVIFNRDIFVSVLRYVQKAID